MVQRLSLSWWQFLLAIVSQCAVFYIFSVEQTNRLTDLSDSNQKRSEENAEAWRRWHTERDEEFRRWQIDREDTLRKEQDARLTAAMNAQREVPTLIFETNRRVEDGHRLTFTNRSPIYDAVIRQIRFQLTSPRELARMASIHTPPLPGQVGGCPMFGQLGDFVQGCWIEGEIYEFRADTDMSVSKGGSGAITLRISNDFYRNERFVGELYIYFNGHNSPVKLEQVEVQAGPSRRDFLQNAAEPAIEVSPAPSPTASEFLPGPLPYVPIDSDP